MRNLSLSENSGFCRSRILTKQDDRIVVTKTDEKSSGNFSEDRIISICMLLCVL